MDEISEDLNHAYNDQLLIDVFPKNQSIVYTGRVLALDYTGVVLRTYDDYGLTDGAVYLSLDVIDWIDFDSDDLDRMNFRIRVAKSDLVEPVQIEIPFDSMSGLMTQITSWSMANQQVIMLMQNDDPAYYEGIVTDVMLDEAILQTVNKFDFLNQPSLVIPFDSISVIEFSGKELTMESTANDTIAKKDHVDKLVFESRSGIADSLADHVDSEQLLMITPQQHTDMSYVGTVAALNQEAVLLKLVDMVGQFGGYVLIARRNIASVTTASDYLTSMQVYVMINEVLGTASQPVLNDERLFDSTDDLFLELISQAVHFNRLVRIRMHDGQNELIYPLSLQNDQLDYAVVDGSEILSMRNKPVSIREIDELAFDYLDVYLVTKENQSNGL
ncbi:hypothetical protein [Levilactobacillus bambusae]|uniref:Uncharacterized protein n=1 Tax=Levilactobacillus bambusae TaxID=2024736 RepID=A0A2V1MZ44_9LACO|nr:hypothetical protein [Levilactobacillus bambusae]PWG00082.1 hypothetical protein DCM90_03865 [Levilactobacillus bambusae]